jgi:hydrogenase nickel incorporation protein HypA/HybF
VHEITVVANIIDIAEKEARKAGAHSVTAIDIEIGKLSCVERTAFDFAWKHGVRNTLLENAKRTTHIIPGKARCKTCGDVFELSELFEPCPNCGGYLSEIMEGNELKVRSLRIEETTNI